MVQHHHAKVIWRRGFGVYANLTQSAWYKNVEAGCLFPDSEITDDLDQELSEVFSQFNVQATPLTEELRDWTADRAKKLVTSKLDTKSLWQHPSIKQWPSLIQTTPKAARDDQLRSAKNVKVLFQ